MSLDHWLFRCIQTMDDPRMNLVQKTDKEKLQMIRDAFDDYRKKATMNHTDQIEYEVDQRDDGTFLVTGTNGMELLIVPAKTDAQRQESARLDWLMRNNGAQFSEFSMGDKCITMWICHSEPGNEMGHGGNYIARGKSYRECIDHFLSGDIKRID
jgi:hypothetical protein